MRRRAIIAAPWAAASIAAARPGRALWRPGGVSLKDEDGITVDLSLVLATDVSSSIDDDEARLQREGYRAALTDPAVLDLIAAGRHAAVGVAYVEWSGPGFQRLLLPWTHIASRADATAWSAALALQPLAPASRRRGTSISGGIEYSLRVLEDAPWRAARRVIDVCGDGPNNNGDPVERARDKAVADGVTVNGLAIEGSDPSQTGIFPPRTLGEYYRDAVIGGPAAFVLVAKGLEDFTRAIKQKITAEIAVFCGCHYCISFIV